MKTTETTHHVAVIARYLPPTNYRGSRIKLILPRWDGKSIVRDWDYRHGDAAEQAMEVLAAAGIEIAGFADMGDRYVVLLPFGQHDKLAALFDIPTHA